MIEHVWSCCFETLGIYGILAVAGVFGAFVKWKTTKKPIPVFSEDYVFPRKQIERDEKVRNAVMRQSFKVSKVSSTVYDVIVIGSGPGGLSSAVLLSRLGYKVLVLEQHDRAGGTCHTYIDKGFEFETGVHYLGNIGPGESWRTLLDQLTRNQVDFHVLDDAFDQVVVAGDDGDKARWFKVISGENRYMAQLIKYFPNEKIAIQKFCKVMKDCDILGKIYVILKMVPASFVRLLNKFGIFTTFINVYKKGWHKTTLQEFVTSLTDNLDLQRVLTYMTADLGALPSEISVGAYSLVNRHYIGGAYFPIGGTSEIPYHMCAEIQERGGQVLVNANIKSIVCNAQGEVVGVRVEKPDVEIRAKYIISNAGFTNTFHKLLPRDIAIKSDMYPLVEQIGISNSFVTVFLGLDGSPEDLGLPCGNIWLFKDGYTTDTGFGQMYYTKYEDLPEDYEPPIIYIASGSAKNPDSKNSLPGRTSMTLILLSNYQWFSDWFNERKGHRGQDYEDRKRDMAERAWKRCLTILPQLADKVLYMDVGTSATNRYYLGSSQGEMYGLVQSTARFDATNQSTIRPDTGIPGLYVAGADVLSIGLVSSMYTGLLAASKISGRNLSMEFESFHNSLIK